MKLRPALVLIAAVLVASGSLIALAQTPAAPAPRVNVTIADYTRALGLQAKYTGQALNVAESAGVAAVRQVLVQQDGQGRTEFCPRRSGGARRRSRHSIISGSPWR